MEFVRQYGVCLYRIGGVKEIQIHARPVVELRTVGWDVESKSVQMTDVGVL